MSSYNKRMYKIRKGIYLFWPLPVLVVISFTPMSGNCVVTDKIHSAILKLEIKSNQLLGIEPEPDDAYKGLEKYSVIE